MQDEYKSRLKQWIKPLGTVLLLGGVYILFTKITGWYIPCIIKLVTGKYCPGCGITRMILAFLRLDFPGAFHANPFLFFLLPLLLLYSFVKEIIYIKTGKGKYSMVEQIVLIIVLIATIVFGILRNTQAFSFLAPV